MSSRALGCPSSAGHVAAGAEGWSVRRRVRILILLGMPCAVWYFGWLLNPNRSRHPVPLRHPDRRRALQPNAGARVLVDRVATSACGRSGARSERVAVDVFIPVYKEPPDIVDLTVAAAVGLRGAEVRVRVLDDGNDDAMRDLAAALRRRLHPARAAHRREGGQHQPRPAEDHPPRSSWSSTPTTWRTRTSSRRPLGGWRTPRWRSSRRRSTTPTPSTIGSRRRHGHSRRCSSAPSRAARTGSTRSSAAAPTYCSAARHSRASAGSRRTR